MARARLDSQDGFTLVEVMVTMVILLVGLAGAVTLINGANAITVKTKQREAATNVQRELIEAVRSVPYAQLTTNGATSALQARPGLEDSTPSDSAWTLLRRHTTYTVGLTVCSVDDTRDGFGIHSSGTYCGGQTAGTADTAPDDFKRVVVDLEWTQAGRMSSSRQATIVSNPSDNDGPQITALTRDPSSEEITTAVTSVVFTATTATLAAAVRYTVDGSVVATPTPSGTSSTFAWDIGAPETGAVDGTYVVGATALDSAGLTGATRSLSVKLNRLAPLAPTGLEGGWNATRDGVDLDWRQNNESDIVGYRVYRHVGAGPASVVCSTVATVTDCHDASHAEPLAASYDYYVVALDEVDSAGSKREGLPSATLNVVPTDNRPNPPATLTAALVDGVNQLDWSTPAPTDPAYTGDGIRFFRIYRGGTALGDRFDRTGLGGDSSYTDTAIVGGSLQYWVTSVDDNYSESEPVGPVTLP
jgi:prepilin-type N-terminal cleavage/methylation domain-containing protein